MPIRQQPYRQSSTAFSGPPEIRLELEPHSRRDLSSTDDVRVWVVDMEPGGEWPHVDHHDENGEEFYVVSGEVIEGEQRFGAGTYVFFGPNSSHRPRTETGVRLFGFNLVSA